MEQIIVCLIISKKLFHAGKIELFESWARFEVMTDEETEVA